MEGTKNNNNTNSRKVTTKPVGIQKYKIQTISARILQLEGVAPFVADHPRYKHTTGQNKPLLRLTCLYCRNF